MAPQLGSSRPCKDQPWHCGINLKFEFELFHFGFPRLPQAMAPEFPDQRQCTWLYCAKPGEDAFDLKVRGSFVKLRARFRLALEARSHHRPQPLDRTPRECAAVHPQRRPRTLRRSDRSCIEGSSGRSRRNAAATAQVATNLRSHTTTDFENGVEDAEGAALSSTWGTRRPPSLLAVPRCAHDRCRVMA